MISTLAVEITSVTGKIWSDQLGVCLPHEHILNDVLSWWQTSTLIGLDPDSYRDAPVSAEILWELRNDPFGNLDNCQIQDMRVAESELRLFQDLGGVSIVETTSISIGRDLTRLRELSVATGLNVIAGTGFYLDSSQPPAIKASSEEELVQLMLTDLEQGSDGVLPGIIGEIGVSSEFTPAEHKSLRAAGLVQTQTQLPIQIHLPGWFRLGHRVLDTLEEVGVNPAHVVLCHMGPSGNDTEYQTSLAQRGAWLQYDMIGMEVFYADQGVQCPSDTENATNILRLVDLGFAEQILISQDIFLKSLLRANGGPGYGHILQFFVPRLQRMGADQHLIDQLLKTNPRRMFELPKEKNVR
jgi:phosphotriesterase-related protein